MLLTTPLTTQQILTAKWLGCLWGLRWPAVWLGSIYVIGLVTGGLSILAIPLWPARCWCIQELWRSSGSVLGDPSHEHTGDGGRCLRRAGHGRGALVSLDVLHSA